MICQYLDVSGLMNARLSCKTLKCIVESAAVLENFPVPISNRYEFHKLIECDLPYNNVYLIMEEALDLPDLGQKGGGYIRKLRINNGKEQNAVIQLLSACSHLKQLEIMTVNSVIYQRDSSVFEKVLKNLRFLNTLIIHEIEGRNYDDAEEDVKFFIKLLRNCKQLKKFAVPKIRSYEAMLEDLTVNNDIDVVGGEANLRGILAQHDFGNQNILKVLIKPMLACMALKKNETNKKLCAPLRQINIKNLPGVEGNVLKYLLQFCYENQISLVGLKHYQIHQSIWLNDESEATWNPNYGEVVKSALCLQNAYPLVIFHSLTSLSLEPCYLNTDYTHFPDNLDLSLPHLQNLQVELFSDTEENYATSEFLTKKLLKDYQRPTVKKLKVIWGFRLDKKQYHAVKAKDLANNFKNLKDLDIDGWTNAFDSGFCLVWKHLLKLEKVSLKSCQHLTNKGFVGNYDLTDSANISQRPFNRLTELKSLTISDWKGLINEVAILGSFRWMKLQYFNFTTSSEIPRDSYWALVDTPFANYVQYCFLPEPIRLPKSASHYETPYLSRRKLSQNFTNLKRPLKWTTFRVASHKSMLLTMEEMF